MNFILKLIKTMNTNTEQKVEESFQVFTKNVLNQIKTMNTNSEQKVEFLTQLAMTDVYDQKHIRNAINYGMLDLVKYINSKSPLLSNTKMMNFAIEENQVDIVKFFHSIGIKHSNPTLNFGLVGIYNDSGMLDLLDLLNSFKETEGY